MGVLCVSSIRVYAGHGCIDEEALTGTYFEIDVLIEADLLQAETSDELAHAYDYVQISQWAKEEAQVRSHLIEHVAHRIGKRLRTHFSEAERIEVTVTKHRPPTEQDVASVSYQCRA